MINIFKHFGESVVLRTSYANITGSICAALVLASLEERTIIQLTNDQKVEWLHVHVDSLINSVCGAFGRSQILGAFESLVQQGLVEQRPSEDPFGWTFICRLNVEKVQQELDKFCEERGGAA